MEPIFRRVVKQIKYGVHTLTIFKVVSNEEKYEEKYEGEYIVDDGFDTINFYGEGSSIDEAIMSTIASIIP